MSWIDIVALFMLITVAQARVKRRLWNDMSDVETLTSFHRNIPNKNERIDLDSINNEPQTYRHIDGIIIDNIAEEEADVRIPIFHNAYKTPKPLKRIFIKPRRRSTTTLSTTMTPFMDAMTTSGTHPKQVSEDDIDLVAVCERVKSIAQNYRIRDMPKFARNNCVLIRFYYPNASCTDIITIVDYCFPEYAAAFA